MIALVIRLNTLSNPSTLIISVNELQQTPDFHAVLKNNSLLFIGHPYDERIGFEGNSRVSATDDNLKDMYETDTASSVFLMKCMIRSNLNLSEK